MSCDTPNDSQRIHDGFFYCEHCNHVVELEPDLEFLETHKCPRCKKWAVIWRVPSPKYSKPEPRPVPAFSEVAKLNFQKMREVCA